MINYTYESLFRQDSIDKQAHITGDGINLGNEDLVQGTFELKESINEGDDLRFGSCIASELHFTTSAVDSAFINKVITITETIDEHEEDDFPVGVYKVYEEKWTANRTRKDIVAYDKIYEINNMDVTEWYDSLTFPISLLNFRNSFFNYIGVEQVSTTLINDSFMVQETIMPKTLTGAMVLHAICELNGVFGRMTRDNKFAYTTLGTTPVYSVTPAMYTSCKFEDYSVNTITKVIIRQEENDIGGIAGSGDSVLIVQGNFLAYGSSPEDLEDVAENILSAVEDITYTPCELSCIGNPCVEVGDLITVSRVDGQTFNTYVLSRTLHNIQSIKDEIFTTGNETRVNDLNSAEDEWIQLLGRSNKLTRTVDETVSQVATLGTSVTTLTQTSEYLTTQVQEINRELDGENLVWEGEGVPTLLNYPYWDFTRAIPCNGTIRLDEIYDVNMNEGGNQFPHFTYTEEDRKEHVRDLYIDLDDGNGYRFVRTNNVWNWQLITNSDFSILFNQITELSQDVDSIDARVSNTEVVTADHEVRITDNEATLAIQATEIEAKVSETYGNNSSDFSWVLKSSGFELKNTGTTVFKVNSSGAEINGKVTATSGYIGNGVNGFTIGNTYIRNGMTSLSDTTHDGVYIGTNGIALGKGAFKVTSAGALTMNSGSINLGNNFIVNSSGAVTIKSGSIALGSNFAVNSSGVVTVKSGSINLGNGVFTVDNNGYMTATSGRISTWNINQYGLLCHNDVFPNDSFFIGLSQSTTPFRDYLITANRNLTIGCSDSSRLSIETSGSGVLNISVGTYSTQVTGNVITKNSAQHVAIMAGDQNFSCSVRNSNWVCCFSTDGVARLGDSDRRWGQIYSTNSVISTSDKKEKKSIKSLRKSAREFIMNLNPVSYQMKNGESGRTHYGLIAQDVEETMKELGMTDTDFAGFCKDGDRYGLRYEEFIAPLIKTVQLMQDEINDLRSRI